MTFGRPAPDVLDALLTEDISWEVLGSDWLALDYPRNLYTDPPTLDQRGLYLVDPDDRIYAVSALPSDVTDVVSVSWAGRLALLRGGVPTRPIGVLDLETTAYREVLPETRELEIDIVTFTTAGDGLWIYDIIPASQFEYLESVRVSRVDLVSGTWVTVFEESVDDGTGSDYHDYYSWWINSRGGVAEMPNGEIVTATQTGVWIGAQDAEPFQRLSTPDASCSVVRAWSETQVLIECEMSGGEVCDAPSSGLWLVPTDGRSSTMLALPEEGTCISYHDAVPLEGGLAISAVFGPGECNHHVVVVGADGHDRWVAPVEEVRCHEQVLGLRNGAWLMIAYNPYVGPDFPMALFEASPTTATIVDIPSGWVHQLKP
jgi:hypothetical protein